MDDNWSFEDKKRLLGLLYKFGADDYELINRHMPQKSTAEIEEFCERYMKIALRKWEKSRANNDVNGSSLKNWLSVFKKVNSAQSGSLTDIVPRVLKYIALFEKRLDHPCINLKECYLVLSEVSRGLPQKNIDETSAYFFYECLLKLAKSINQGGAHPSLRHLKYLTKLKIFEDKDQQIKRRKMFSEVTNPLSIPENLLKMNQIEKDLIVFE